MSKYSFVGSGIASLAGAAYLIHDAKVSGRDIAIFDESKDFGGALDAHGTPSSGYFMSGSRMFEHHYNATFDLFSFIPSTGDPTISVKEETDRVDRDGQWHNRSRLIDHDGNITEFHDMGFSEMDRLRLLALLAEPERMLDSKRITDCFSAHFFKTNFWFEWCSLFAFEEWHSAIEFRRYLLRFIHHFATIDTQEGIFRTRFNQYESMAVPLVRWLKEKGVEFKNSHRVTHIGFDTDSADTTVNSLQYEFESKTVNVVVEADDLVFVTNGSMTADKSFGTMHSAPVPVTKADSTAWKLWETMSIQRPEFGNPAVFDSNIKESSWESFTVTMNDPTFIDRFEKFSGSKPGTGGLMTFKDSQWLITLSIFKQPFYGNQPDDVFVWWGYGLRHDRPGDFVKKTMAECTGAEILEEVLGHLKFDADKEKIMASANVIPCMMPYITSQFLVRKHGDRPEVVPKRSQNLAFIGQFAELPDDVVFTVEYSVRSAQMAVYKLMNLDKKPSEFYKGQHDPSVLWEALKTLHR